MNTQSYHTRRMPDGCDHDQLTQIGDFSWRYYPAQAGSEHAGKIAGMAIIMPGANGQGEINWIPVNHGAPLSGGDHTWGWDGNLDAPTLQPSLHLINHWHGWMQSGRLVSC